MSESNWGIGPIKYDDVEIELEDDVAMSLLSLSNDLGLSIEDTIVHILEEVVQKEKKGEFQEWLKKTK